MFTIPTSVKRLCVSKNPYTNAEMKKAWDTYMDTKTVPESQEDKLLLASILNLNRTDYVTITGLRKFQSPYLTVHDMPFDGTNNTVEAHKALLDSIPTPLEKLLLYPSISMALYAKAALETGKLPDVDKLAEYVANKGNSLPYRITSGLLTSAEEAVDLEDPFFLKAIETIAPLFSKRFFLQGTVLFSSTSPESPYDITNPLIMYPRAYVPAETPTEDFSVTYGITEETEREENPLTAPIATLFSRSDVASRPEMDAVWRKLRTHKVRPTRSLMADMKAIANFIRDTLTDSEKLAAINIINQTRPHYLEIVGHTKLASPLYVLLRKPLEPITREEHIQLRELLLEEGGLTALYLLYPSLSIAIQAQAGLAVNWPQGGQDLAIKFKTYINHCGATYQNRLNVRLLKKNIDEPADALYSTMRALVPLTATRHVFQGAVLFCRSQCVSMYDLNNVITLKGECITEHGAELPENQNIKWKYKL